MPSPSPLSPRGQAGYTNLDGAPSSPRLEGQPQRQSQNPFYDAGGSPSQSRFDLTDPHGSDTSSMRRGIVSGQIGGDYGPYSPSTGSFNRYSTRSSSRPSPFAGNLDGSYSAPPSPSLGSTPQATASVQQHRAAAATAAAASSSSTPLGSRAIPVYTAKDAAYDEKLHALPPGGRYRDTRSGLSWQGFLNLTALFVIVAALVGVFAGYPIAQWATSLGAKTYGAYNIGGTNGSGMVPDIPNLPSLIDKDTPSSALTRTGFDGKKYVLVFSDEFETEGRTFWPGDDPYWEAVDLHYWPTNDYEAHAVTTEGGSLKITMTEEPIHGMNFRSGMLQSWNKMCFTGGYVEVSIRLPGAHNIGGLWPGAWTMGNLGRAGYGATSDGTWPYSYSSCDVGTLPNQTNVDGTGPAAALNTGSNKGTLSFQAGQRLSACTCKGGDHPGPSPNVGRGAPEIDILEAQMFWDGEELRGAVSQSAQFAPYDDHYQPKNTSEYIQVYNNSKTQLNEYLGGVYQQATSAISYTNPRAYELSGGEFETYGFEWDNDETDGYITWTSNGEADWTLTAAAVGPNSKVAIGQRLISQEPHYIVLNLGISDSFQTIDYGHLQFPAVMLVDYVRVYQQEGKQSVTCDPASHPTSKYIQDHLNAYMNANLTTWEQAGYKVPKNSLQGC
ncbi:hypothetical protein JCM10213v2_006618 [Rhodosporidiobolus nylandii]